jgi:hypothetical protein
MKKPMFIVAGLLLSLATYAQKIKESAVPSIVKDAFKNTYKDAKDTEWEKEDGNFEVEFEIGETDQSIVYDPTGIIIEKEVEIKVKELPSAVGDYIANNYKDKKIKEATKISSASGSVSYEAEIKDKDLIFDENGRFIKEEVDKEDHKD